MLNFGELLHFVRTIFVCSAICMQYYWVATIQVQILLSFTYSCIILVLTELYNDVMQYIFYNDLDFNYVLSN